MGNSRAGWGSPINPAAPVAVKPSGAPCLVVVDIDQAGAAVAGQARNVRCLHDRHGKAGHLVCTHELGDALVDGLAAQREFGLQEQPQNA